MSSRDKGDPKRKLLASLGCIACYEFSFWILISFILSKFYSFPFPFPPFFHNFLLFSLILFSSQSLQNSFVWSSRTFLVTCLIRQAIHPPSRQNIDTSVSRSYKLEHLQKTFIKDKTTKTLNKSKISYCQNEEKKVNVFKNACGCIRVFNDVWLPKMAIHRDATSLLVSETLGTDKAFP